MTDKPTIGIKPEAIWKNERRHELVKAMDRRIEAGQYIPMEWVEEYNRLTLEVSK